MLIAGPFGHVAGESENGKIAGHIGANALVRDDSFGEKPVEEHAIRFGAEKDADGTG